LNTFNIRIIWRAIYIAFTLGFIKVVLFTIDFKPNLRFNCLKLSEVVYGQKHMSVTSSITLASIFTESLPLLNLEI